MSFFRAESGWRTRALFWLAVAVLVLPVVFRQVAVSDAWWHIALGKWLVSGGGLGAVGAWSFVPTETSGIPAELRWSGLGDVILMAMYSMAGPAGLQLLSLGLLAGALGILGRMAPGTPSAWTVLLMGALTLGTYQLQLPRNAMFSLVMYPLVLRLGVRGREQPGWREYGLMGGLLVFWSFLHGSCLLGWVTAVLLFGGRVVGAVVTHRSLRPIAAFLGFCILTLAALSWGRPEATGLLTSPIQAFFTPQQESQKTVAVAEPEVSTNEATEKNLPRPLAWLNRTLWKPDSSVPRSNDFLSPFELPPSAPFLATVALSLLALISLVVGGTPQVGLVLAWLGAVGLGLGYVRMMGYASLASAAVILSCRPHWKFPGKWPARINLAGAVCVLLAGGFLWIQFSSGRMDRLIGEGQHVSRWGATPNHDTKTLAWVRRELPDSRTFTTIVTGSSALLEWDFEKPVFVDGFFATTGKNVWSAYAEAKATGSAAGLHKEFGITSAIVQNTSADWLDVFFGSPDWFPVAIGPGSTVFLHTSQKRTPAMPAVLVEESDLTTTSDLFARHTSLAALAVLGHAHQTRTGFDQGTWIRRNPGFFSALGRLAEERHRGRR